MPKPFERRTTLRQVLIALPLACPRLADRAGGGFIASEGGQSREPDADRSLPPRRAEVRGKLPVAANKIKISSSL
jgi:hypothetical protein